MSKHVALGLYACVFTLLCCFVLYCLCLAFRTAAPPSLVHKAAATNSSWIWRQFQLSFGILTFGYCLLEIRLICAVSTPKLIQQKPFLPEVVCGICGKVDNTVSLLGSASLCFSGVFQGYHVSRVLFEFHSCLWLPWEDSKCPEFSKGAFLDFWRTNKRFVALLFADLVTLSTFHASQSAVAKLCAAPALRSPVYYRRLLLCSAFCRHHPRAHDEREKSHGKTLIGPQVCPPCAFLLNHTVTHLPHRQEFMFFRNVLVTSEKQQVFVITTVSVMVCIWR